MIQLANGADFGAVSAADGQSSVNGWNRWRVSRIYPALTHATESQLVDACRAKNSDKRWAAAIAIRERKMPLVDTLIELLADSQATIRNEGHLALIQLAKQDLGPAAQDDPQEIAAAQKEWHSWWSKETGKLSERELSQAKTILANNPDAGLKRLRILVAKYPHTDAAVEAMQLLDANEHKPQ